MDGIDICKVCKEPFDDDPDQVDKRDESHLPVQSSKCRHIMCYNCVVRSRLSKAEKASDKQFAKAYAKTKWLECPWCREKTSFNADYPIVSYVMCELLRDRREKTTSVTAATSNDRAATFSSGEAGNTNTTSLNEFEGGEEARSSDERGHEMASSSSASASSSAPRKVPKPKDWRAGPRKKKAKRNEKAAQYIQAAEQKKQEQPSSGRLETNSSDTASTYQSVSSIVCAANISTADTQAGVEATLELHGGVDDDAEEKKKDDSGEAEEEESARKKPKSAKKKKGKLHRTASDLLDESDDEDDSDDFVQQDDDEEEELDAKMDYDEDAVEADDAPASPEPKARKKKSSKKKSKMEALPPITSPLTTHNRNDPGKPAEAGVIRRVYVENFMCHRKLTVDLCRNVNFIYGQNGSGKVRYVNCISSYRYDCDTWAGVCLSDSIRYLFASSCKHLAKFFSPLSPFSPPFFIVLSTDNSPPSWPPSRSASVPAPAGLIVPPTSRSWSGRRPDRTAMAPRSASPS